LISGEETGLYVGVVVEGSYAGVVEDGSYV